MYCDVSYLREKAHFCVALARECSDLTTAQALEGLGTELMEKAAELEDDRSIAPSSHDTKTAQDTKAAQDTKTAHDRKTRGGKPD